MRLTFEGDRDVVLAYLQSAEQELFSLKERMRALGQSQGSFHASFGSGAAYAYGYVLPTGLTAMHIVATDVVSDGEPVDFNDPQIPDFLSGYLVSGGLVEVKGEELVRDFRPGQSCVRLHPKEVRAGRNQVRRLAIRPGDVAGMNSGAEIAQSAVIRPTNYSGTMRKVVQFIFGLGKQFSDESIYDAAEPELPDEILIGEEEIEAAEQADNETSYEAMVKSQGVRLLYDYRFQRTHGLIRAADNKWWLVEISEGKGIIATRLPIVKYTDLDEMREKCVNLGDDEAVTVLDLFGGFPSGESFPTDAKAIESAERSGRIIRLKTASDLSGFYQLSGYSSIMGWSFSDSGSEAHNTGFRHDDAGYAHGEHWACQMTVGPFIDVEPHSLAEELKAALSEAESEKSKQVFAEVMWKCDRLTGEQIDGFLGTLDTKTAAQVFDDVDQMVLVPSAPSTCSFTKVSEGYLWHRALYGTQVKFPEPILGGCISAPIYQENWDLPPVACDTTLHVFFVGEVLKWVKYYVKPGASQSRVVSDSYTGNEDIPVGDFYLERHGGEFGVAPSVYTNDFDERIERGATIYTERHKRRFSGYYEYLTRELGVGDRIGDFIDRGFDPPLPANFIEQAPFIYRNARFSYEEWRSTRNSIGQRGAVVIPMEDRCAYFYTLEEVHGGGLDFYWFHYEVVSDPHVGVYDWPRRSSSEIQSMHMTYSVGSSIWPNHQQRIDFADQGDWVPIGGNVLQMVTKQAINLDWYSYTNSVSVPSQASLTCWLVCGSHRTPVRVFAKQKTGGDFYPQRWFWQSPDPESGTIDFINSTHNVLGDSDALIYSDDINETDRTLLGNPQDQVLRAVIPTFIGPFNG